jgi:NAD(P)H dehydrogenase (quinone)
MKLGLIVYSQTGHTKEVAMKVMEAMKANGLNPSYESIEAEGGGNPGEPVTLNLSPDASAYDEILFAAPVQAFNLCPVMKEYLKNVASLDGKKIALLTTEQLPYPWMGGNNAIKQMRKACEAKGGEIVGSAVINWSSKKKDQMIEDAVQKLSEVFA